MSTGDCEVSKSDKINGYDSWEVRSKADTLIEAEEIKNGDPKLYSTVLDEVQKKATAAQEAADKKKAAADSIRLEKKVDKKLKKTFGA